MVPIHDTDLGEHRWSESEWENYELWEKVELRLKRQKRLWILLTVVVFLCFSAIPTLLDKWPKWKTRSAARQLAQEVNRMKREASIEKVSHRLKFINNSELSYQIEKIKSCQSGEVLEVKKTAFINGFSQNEYLILSPLQGKQLGIPGLIDSFCYDYLTGNPLLDKADSVVGFAIAPVKDLAEQRLDRVSLLLLTGSAGEVSFE